MGKKLSRIGKGGRNKHFENLVYKAFTQCDVNGKRERGLHLLSFVQLANQLAQPLAQPHSLKSARCSYAETLHSWLSKMRPVKESNQTA